MSVSVAPSSNLSSFSDSLLDVICDPQDFRGFSIEDLEHLCSDIREELVSVVGRVGGHLASNLGAVELAVACHVVFDTPRDRLVWDVGHQAYAHKILTGRRKGLDSIRQLGGISGFPRRSESQYDSFGVGHAGTSISAASGMLEAIERGYAIRYVDCVDGKEQCKSQAKVVAIIGDGAMTSGMAFEALNHSGQLHKNLIVVLNDNEMSIAPNVGAISLAFSSTLNSYLGTFARRHFKSLVEKGLIPRMFYRGLDKLEDAAQAFLSSPALLFEAFGYRYIGPVYGHDLEQLLGALEKAKMQDSPVLVHVATTKGKGFAPAEADPVKYHGIEVAKKSLSSEVSHIFPNPTYTDVFGQTVLDLCKQDDRVVAITAAMPDGTGLKRLSVEMPDRLYDVGIAEQHAVTFAAGLACEGARPICAIYSSFLQRAFDQILHDVCLQQLPVIFALDRGGLVGNDGATHHGVFDLSYLRSMPNLTLMSPKNELELRDMLHAAIGLSGPVAIRYPRGVGVGADLSLPVSPIEIGKGEVLYRSSKTPEILLLAIGPVVNKCMAAALELDLVYGLGITLINARFVKPLDTDLLLELIGSHSMVVTVEDNTIVGGFGSAILEFMADHDLLGAKFVRLGVPDEFIEHGTQEQLYKICGYDTDGIISRVLDQVSSKSYQSGRIQYDTSENNAVCLRLREKDEIKMSKLLLARS